MLLLSGDCLVVNVRMVSRPKLLIFVDIIISNADIFSSSNY